MSGEMHRLLARQLRRSGLSADSLPTDLGSWQQLLARVGRAYGAAEDDRYTLERAMDVSSRELRAAIDAAQAASRAKSAFLANMSHEIRTPMNGVIGVADLLGDTNLDDAQQDLVETLRRSGESLLLLLDDILDLSKIDAGRLVLEQKEFDVAELVGDIAELLAENAFRKGVELTCLVDPDVSPMLRGDPNRVRQVLLNLVGNAIKFTASGFVAVRVRLLHRRDGRETLWFEVADSGIGVDADTQQRLFEPFTQADSSTTRRYGGTGLGLSICRRLVEMMDGEIGLESEPGCGSRFWFHVDFDRIAGAAACDPGCDGAVAGMKMLFVDDTETNRRIMRWQCRALGIACWTCDSADEAERMLEADPRWAAALDLVVSDYLMPDRDGLDFARALQRRGLAPEVPIVLLSSAYDLANDERARALDCFAILRKPIRRRELVKLMMRLQSPRTVLEADAAAAAADNDGPLGLRVLLAEDNEINQRVARLMLEGRGCSVVLAADGAQALEAFRSERFDVVLMDCQMPRMGGLDATRAIRRFEAEQDRAATPVVALTANAMESDRQACLQAGMDAFLAKPIRAQALVEALCDVLRAAEAPLADGG